MSTPSWTMERRLYATLTGDAPLMGLVTGVYVDSVPPQTPFPYIYITGLAFDDIAYVGERTVYSSGVYACRVVGEVGGYGALVAAATRMHELLQRQSGSTEAGVVFAIYRERPFRMVERSADRMIHHLGGVYRAYAQG